MLRVCVLVCEREKMEKREAFLAVLQIVDDPGDRLLSCGADVTLRTHTHTHIRNKALVHHLYLNNSWKNMISREESSVSVIDVG